MDDEASTRRDEALQEQKLVGKWIVASTLVVGVCLSVGMIIGSYCGVPSGPAAFGDYFGALNTLFSGLAFTALVITVLLQRDELRATRDEMRQQRVASQQSAASLAASTEIQALTAASWATSTELQALAAALNADLELVKYHKALLEEAQVSLGVVERDRSEALGRAPFSRDIKSNEEAQASVKTKFQSRHDDAVAELTMQRDKVSHLYRSIDKNRVRVDEISLQFTRSEEE